MSSFLRYLRQENDKNTEDLYAEEQRESQVQLTELWNILKEEHSDTDQLEKYIAKWREVKLTDVVDANAMRFDLIGVTVDASTLRFDAIGPDGMKPLHWCCMKGFSTNIIELFLNNGVDIDDNHGSAAGETPLLISVSYAHTDIVRLLVSRGARIDLLDKFGNSPLSVVNKKLKSKNAAMRAIYGPIGEVLESVISKDVDNATTYREEANNLFRAGEYKRAIALYTDSIHHAEDAKTYSNRSQCYLELAKRGRMVEVMELEYIRKMYRQALSDANQCRAMDPAQPKGHFRAALAFIGCGDFPSAVHVLHVGIQRCPVGAPFTASVEDESKSSPLSGVSALHELLEELAMADVPLGREPLELRPKSALLIHHSPRPGRSSREGKSEGETADMGDVDVAHAPTCAWCEMPLPVHGHQSGGGTGDGSGRRISVGEVDTGGSALSLYSHGPCPCCGCRLQDRQTPLRLRKKYLGPSPRDERELVDIESTGATLSETSV
jgi:ankyrin repeat protein